jgi:hypothetical protein
MPEAFVTVASVRAQRTRSGTTRFVLTDEQGREYTTFKEPIARQALAAEGGQARIECHEAQKGSYTNVYLDAVEPMPEASAPDGEEEGRADEVAWRTALEAAPYILGGDAVEREVPPEEFFEKLKPLKDLVADDIRGGEESEDEP